MDKRRKETEQKSKKINSKNSSKDLNQNNNNHHNKNNNNNQDKETNKIIRINTDFESKNFIYTKKLKITFIVVIIIFVLLVGRI